MLIVLGGYFLSIYVAGFFTDRAAFWGKYLKVSTSEPTFLDTHHWTSALDCTRKGYDVLITNPCEPNQQPMDYPRVWLQLTKLGIQQNHSIYIGITCAIVFFLCVLMIIGPISRAEGLLYGAILCSPSIMLGVETGNTDLIMFAILSGAILLLRNNRNYRLGAYSLVLAAGVLKLYPIAAMIACFKERKKPAISTLIIVLTIFAVYIYRIFPDVLQLQNNAIKLTYRSYGIQVVFKMLNHILIESDYRLLYEYLPILLAVLVASIIFFAYTRARQVRTDAFPLDFLDSFRMGASIYIISYLFWNNWDYRFMFVIFTIPQLLLWFRKSQELSSISAFSLIVFVATVWISSRSPLGWKFPTVNHFLLDEVLNLYLFGYFSFALLITLPSWLKAHLFLTPRVMVVGFDKETAPGFSSLTANPEPNQNTSARA